MKKSLLTLGAVIGVAAGACGQGSLLFDIPSTVGVNSVSSSPADANTSGTDYFLNDGTGLLTVSVYYASNSASLLNEATTINTDDKSATTLAAGVAALQADFTQESFTGEGGGGSTIVSGTLGMYALLVTYTGGYEGVMALNGGGTAYSVGGGQNPAASMFSNWASNQNLLLAIPTGVPEPATLALAGLGGLSMLFFRRRKA
jgi:hypothetical protein